MLLAAFIVAAVGMLVVMAAAWVTQRAVNNAGWIDVFWTFGSGAMCVMMALWPAPAESLARQALVAGLSALWALRLGFYIAGRVGGAPEDTRYAQLRKDWGASFDLRLFLFALLQAPAAALLALSVYAAAHAGGAELGFRDFLGAAILLIAIGGEALADEQMRRFKARPDHGPIMDRGLWAWSRHPNYFFEWLSWLAYPIIAFDPAVAVTWLTLLAPALMYLILRHGTGVPALEKSMLKSRGEAFRAYQERVSAFFPMPSRRRPAS